MKQLNKKGILGLETVRVVIVTLLVLAVTAIAVFLALVSLQSSDLFTDDSLGTLSINESVGPVNETGVDFGNNTLASAVCTITLVLNATDDIVIDAGNYTQTNCNIAYSAAADSSFNNTLWEVSSTTAYTQTSQVESDTDSIVNNITNGTTQFFANVPTYMILLGVVVLLLIIAIILVVVSRFASPNAGEGSI